MADASSNSIDLSIVQAAISWPGEDGQARYLFQNEGDSSQIIFEIYFDAASLAALFRIRTTVELKAFPNEKTPLYLYLYADRIASLVYDEHHRIPEEIRGRLGVAPRCLQFNLARPADLVTPQKSLVPVKQKGGDRLDAMKFLARVTSWTVYLKDDSVLSETLLRDLCTAVAERKLKALSGPVALSGLYAGKGGKVYEGSELQSPLSELPSYNKLESPPPPDLELKTKSKPRRTKRRRDDDEDDVEAICERTVERMMARHRQAEREYLRAELRQLKMEILAHIEERVHKLVDEYDLANVCTEEDLDYESKKAQDYNDTLIDVKLDDRIDGVKIELEDYVKDELRNVEETLLGRLKTATLVLEIDD